MAKAPDLPDTERSPRPGEGASSKLLRRLTRWPVRAGDLLVLGVAYAWVGLRDGAPLPGSRQAFLFWGICLLSGALLLLWLGLYTRQRKHAPAGYGARWLLGVNACALVAWLEAGMVHAPVNRWSLVGAFWGGTLLGMAGVRAATLGWEGLRRGRQGGSRTFLVVGSGERASRLAARILAGGEPEARLLGYVDSEPQAGFIADGMLLGGIDDLERILQGREVDLVVIALPMKSQYEAVGYAIAVCQMLGVESRYYAEGNDAPSGMRHDAPARLRVRERVDPRSGKPLAGRLVRLFGDDGQEPRDPWSLPPEE